MNILWKWYWLLMITVMIFKPVQRRKLPLFSPVNSLCRQNPQTNQLNNKIRQTGKVGMNCSTAFLKKIFKLAVIAAVTLFLVLQIRNLHWRGKKHWRIFLSWPLSSGHGSCRTLVSGQGWQYPGILNDYKAIIENICSLKNNTPFNLEFSFSTTAVNYINCSWNQIL